MVATSQPLAVAAGLDLLRAGGNAADAAVATAAALNVTEPTSTGIGGDVFVLYYQAATGQVSALNGSGRAPQALTLERLRRDLDGEFPPYHAHTVTVPGACAAWSDLLDRFGRLGLAAALAPAIRLADTGFPVALITAAGWKRGAENQLSKAPNGHELTITGRAPRAGEIFRNPGLARTLQAVAAGGKVAFYEGSIAEAIVAVLRQAGGVMDAVDLAGHRSTWEQPISTTYRGLRVWECPPNGQGLAALLALNLVEGFDLASLPSLGAERLHLEIEAMRLAFADARWFIADPAMVPVPTADLLSKEYASRRRQLIDPSRAAVDPRRGVPGRDSGTVYLSVVDGEGNACSLINSNYMGFGTGIVPKGWGFSLQNRGHNFELDPAHPNVLAPGKRPYNTIIPALITRPDPAGFEQLYASYGVMGGFMQPQGHLQVAIGLIDDGLDPQAALDRPRFCIEGGESGGAVALEEGIPLDSLAGLADLGHRIRIRGGSRRSIFGRGQVILYDRDTGVMAGGSDPRADGCAMAL